MEISLEKINQAVAACQLGSNERFAEIYDAYIGPIYGFIYQKTFNRETAEDLTSKTFISALRNIKQFDAGRASFNTWLYRIARNNVIDYFRAHHENQDIESAYDLSSKQVLDTDLANKLLLEQVQKCLAGLDQKQRSVVTMRLWDGLSYKEIADVLDISVANAKMIFSRSLVKLRSDLINMVIYAMIALNI